MLEGGAKPSTLKGEKLPLRAESFEWYLPWEDKSVKTSTPTAPDFTISAVVRFTNAGR